jgi:hypothetical protein
VRTAALRILLLAVSAALAAPAAAGAQDPLTHGGEQLVRAVESTTAPDRHEAAIQAFEGSWTARTLAFQHHLAGDVGMLDATWLGTHNSYNSQAEVGPSLSATDSNQELTSVDQLRVGVRSLELDLHWFPAIREGAPRAPVVCHAQPDHTGCTTERTLAPVLRPIAGWLHENPGEVVLLYLEDRLDTQEGHDAAAAIIERELGDLVHAPGGAEGECTHLPAGLTRDDVLAAGAQVVIVSDCGAGAAWRSQVFDWSERREARPVGYQDFPECGPAFTREEYDTRLIRFFEDRTWLTHGASHTGQTHRDEGLTPETAAAMTRCGVNLFGFDHLLPGDGRHDALVWSWADGQPAAGGDCAVQADGGRWSVASCVPPRPPACRTADGGWVVPTRPATPRTAARTCEAAGATFAAPRTGHENALLGEAGGGATVLLGLERSGDGWRALDAR